MSSNPIFCTEKNHSQTSLRVHSFITSYTFQTVSIYFASLQDQTEQRWTMKNGENAWRMMAQKRKYLYTFLYLLRTTFIEPREKNPLASLLQRQNFFWKKSSKQYDSSASTHWWRWWWWWDGSEIILWKKCTVTICVISAQTIFSCYCKTTLMNRYSFLFSAELLLQIPLLLRAYFLTFFIIFAPTRHSWLMAYKRT